MTTSAAAFTAGMALPMATPRPQRRSIPISGVSSPKAAIFAGKALAVTVRQRGLQGGKGLVRDLCAELQRGDAEAGKVAVGTAGPALVHDAGIGFEVPGVRRTQGDGPFVLTTVPPVYPE